MNVALLTQKFINLYKTTPSIFRSPGRINLIGEHTDYNNGFVLPAAIDKEIVFAIAKNNRKECRVYSLDLNETYTFSLDQLKKQEHLWLNYIIGVVAECVSAGANISEGFDCVFGGDVPLGAGLSSSAALECSLAFGINKLYDSKFTKTELAKIAQKAEHNFAGVKCGIMDQFASVFGKSNHVLKIDCNDLSHEYYPIDLKDYTLLLCDTNIEHSLASSEYNTRREQCEEGVRILQKYDNKIESLRDVSLELLEKHKSEFPQLIYQRCSYVIQENSRVIKTCLELQNGNLEEVGKLMYQSHDGLSNDYEVSCKELDFLVEFTLNKPEVLGARMMGGGFGGCTLNLIKSSEMTKFIEEISKAYKKETGIELKTYHVTTGDGSREYEN